LAARAERFREDWVKRQLVDAGSARAQSLGWPDAYAFTKALGERALVSQHGPAGANPVPLSIVRPSIIESALSEPRPGWIRGFRMAEPIIISYARGLLREFPGVAEGIIDVIPVDLVVAAIIAVAAKGPDTSGPAVFHVASGVRNPLAYGLLVDLAQDWFGRHPLYDERGQPISVPAWSFPGRGRVQRQLRQATRVMGAAERALTMVPFRRKQAEWTAALEERQTLAERALGYVELYGAYTETEARYRIDHLLALFEALDPEDQATFCFDPAVIDWAHYVAEVHFPSVVERGRVRTSPTRQSGPDRETRMRTAVLSADRHLAVFDLEHTLIASNVVDSYAWLASRHLEADTRVGFVADLLGAAPRWLALDRRDRGDFLRSFYRRYEGAPVDEVTNDAWDLFHEFLLPRSFPAGLARVRHHRRLGHRTLLITGALDLVVAPLAPLFDDVVCARLSERDGRFTGRLAELPPIGEARALLLDRYAEEHDLKLDQSVAYADASSDLAMLEAVGYPVAVNPDARLAAIARRRGWLVEHWKRASGGTDRFLPIGSLDVRSLVGDAGESR
jgi:HAD superfamily hydrolase (TIGR01490 family)